MVGGNSLNDAPINALIEFKHMLLLDDGSGRRRSDEASNHLSSLDQEIGWWLALLLFNDLINHPEYYELLIVADAIHLTCRVGWMDALPFMHQPSPATAEARRSVEAQVSGWLNPLTIISILCDTLILTSILNDYTQATVDDDGILFTCRVCWKWNDARTENETSFSDWEDCCGLWRAFQPYPSP